MKYEYLIQCHNLPALPGSRGKYGIIDADCEWDAWRQAIPIAQSIASNDNLAKVSLYCRDKLIRQATFGPR